MIERRTIWSEAGRQAIPLACISVAYLLIGWGISKIDSQSKLLAVLINVSAVLLWAIKFGACLQVTRSMIRKFSDTFPEAGFKDVFRFGVVLAFLSALLYSACHLAYMLFLDPESISKAMETAMSSYSSFMDADSLSRIEEMIPRMPRISFFVNLCYCTLFGTVLSAIYSSGIQSGNPFGDNTEQ